MAGIDEGPNEVFINTVVLSVCLKSYYHSSTCEVFGLIVRRFVSLISQNSICIIFD